VYYYIFEQTKKKRVARTYEKIKDQLTDLGITGEIVTPSPARTTEELTAIGLQKGYSTIVGVGSSQHINKIASQLEGQKAVLGVIPLTSSTVSQMIGVSDIKSACEALRFRKLEEIDLVLIEPNKYYLTQAEIHITKPQELYFELGSLVVGRGYFTDLTITHDLNFYLDNTKTQGAGLGNFWGWLWGKKKSSNNFSHFHSRRIKIETVEPLPIIVNGEVVAKTPAVFHLKQKALKLIVARSKLAQGDLT